VNEQDVAAFAKNAGKVVIAHILANVATPESAVATFAQNVGPMAISCQNLKEKKFNRGSRGYARIKTNKVHFLIRVFPHSNPSGFARAAQILQVAIVLLSTARSTGRRRQKNLWQKDGGIACQTAIFCRRSFCLIRFVPAYTPPDGCSPLPVEAFQASCLARAAEPRVVRCAANPGLGSSTLSELFPIQVVFVCGPIFSHG